MPNLTPMRLLFMAVIITSIGPVLVRESPVGPASTAFWRLMIALPLSFWLSHRAPKLSARDTGWALLAGILLACDLVLWNNAILSTSVMEATVLVMLFPLIVAALEIGLFGRQLAPKLLMGGAIAFVGTAVIAVSAARGESSLPGDAMAVGAAVFYAVSMLISAQLCQRVDNRSVTPWVVVGGALGALPIMMSEKVIVAHDIRGWSYLALYGAITFASYALYNSALSKLPTTLVAISGYGQPVIATALAMILLGEVPTLGGLLGGGVVIVGLVIATIDRGR